MTMTPNFRQNYRMGLRGAGDYQSAPQARQAFRAGGMSGDALHSAMQGFRQGGMQPGDQPPPAAPTAPAGTPAWMKEMFVPQSSGVNEPQNPNAPMTPLFNTFASKDNPLASLGQNFNPSMGGFMPSERFQKPEDFYRSMWDSLGGDYQKHFQNTYQGDPWIQFLMGGGNGTPVPGQGGGQARKAANMSSLFGALR